MPISVHFEEGSGIVVLTATGVTILSEATKAAGEMFSDPRAIRLARLALEYKKGSGVIVHLPNDRRLAFHDGDPAYAMVGLGGPEDESDGPVDLEKLSALEESGEVADSYYESTAQSALFFGARIAERITEERLLREDAKDQLEALVLAKQREYNRGGG